MVPADIVFLFTGKSVVFVYSSNFYLFNNSFGSNFNCKCYSEDISQLSDGSVFPNRQKCHLARKIVLKKILYCESENKWNLRSI